MKHHVDFDPSTGEVYEQDEKTPRPKSQEVDFSQVTPRDVIELVMFQPREIVTPRDEDKIRQALTAEAMIAGDAFFTSEESLGGPNLNVRAARAIHRQWGNSVIAITNSRLEGENFVLFGYYADFERRYISAESFTMPAKWHYNIRATGKLKSNTPFKPTPKEIDLLFKNSAQTGVGMLWRNLRTHNTPEHIKDAMLRAAQDALVKKLEGGIDKAGGLEKFVAGWISSILELGVKRAWILRRFALTDVKNIAKSDLATLIHEYKQIKSEAYSVSEFWGSYESDNEEGKDGSRLENMAAAIKKNSPATATATSTEAAPAIAKATATASAPESATETAPAKVDGQDVSAFNPEPPIERKETVENLVALRAKLVALGVEYLERVMRLELTMRANPVNYGAMSLEDMRTLLHGFEQIETPKAQPPADRTAPAPASAKRLRELRHAAEFEDAGAVAQAEAELKTSSEQYGNLTETQMKTLAEKFKKIAEPKKATEQSATQRAAEKDKIARDITLFVGAAGEDESQAGDILKKKVKEVFNRFPKVKYKELLLSDLETLSAIRAALNELVEPFDKAGVPQ